MKQIIEDWTKDDVVALSKDKTSFDANDAQLEERAKWIALRCASIDDQLDRAEAFATMCHNGLCRKFEGIPYIVHPRRVDARVAAYLGHTVSWRIAAKNHDTREDCGVTDEIFRTLFGAESADLVDDLTNRFKEAKGPDGKKLPRAQRKALEFARLKTIRHPSKIIKLIDRIDNLSDMKKNPNWDFVKTYAKEGAQLVESVGDADENLKVELSGIIAEILGSTNGTSSSSR